MDRQKETARHPSMDAEDLTVTGLEFAVMGVRYKPTLSMFVNKKFLSAEKTRAQHFPCGVDKLPSPVIRTVAVCVGDPPGTDDGGKISMPVSTGFVVVDSGSWSAPSVAAGSCISVSDFCDEQSVMPWSMIAMHRAIQLTSGLASSGEEGSWNVSDLRASGA